MTKNSNENCKKTKYKINKYKIQINNKYKIQKMNHYHKCYAYRNFSFIIYLYLRENHKIE